MLKDTTGLEEWLVNLRTVLAEEKGIHSYSIESLRVNFAHRYEEGCTVYKVVEMDFQEPHFR